VPHLHVGAEPALEEVVGVEAPDLERARGDEVGPAAAGRGDVGGAPGPGEVERAAELVEDEGSMSRWDQIVALGEQYSLPVLTIADLRAHLLAAEERENS